MNIENPIILEWSRTRLRMMNDNELLRYGQSARYTCSLEANLGHPPRETFVVQYARNSGRVEAAAS
jgi:hypothetical protein